MDAGDLVPDAVVVGMIRERLAAGSGDDFLLDGFPRTLPQGEALGAMLADLGVDLDAVLYLAVPRESLMMRLAGRWLCRRCGRSSHETFASYSAADDPCPATGGPCDLYQREDDRPEAVANRLEAYDAQTAPLIEYYRVQGVLVEIDGDRSQDEVHEQIAQAVAAA